MSDGTPPRDGLDTAPNPAAVIAFEKAHPHKPGESLEQALARQGLPGRDSTRQQTGGATSKANTARIAASQARIRGTNNDMPARTTQNSRRAATARRTQAQ